MQENADYRPTSRVSAYNDEQSRMMAVAEREGFELNPPKTAETLDF